MASPFDKIVEMIKQLDLHDDGIVMNQKIKSIAQDFCNVVRDERTLSDSMEYINSKVLSDNDASIKFALLISSRIFDSLTMDYAKVRYKMLSILETNFSNAADFRKESKDKFYNSISLLGEYYHRVRLANGFPFAILAESLLDLLTQELNRHDDLEPIQIDLKLAKLILAQVTLNGAMLRSTHKEELNLLLYHIHKCLIEVPDLKPAVKAVLLMTLDLHANNCSSLGPLLEEMYRKYLIEEESPAKNEPIAQNGTCEEKVESKKKWSEQVNEDTSYEAQSDCCDNQSVKEDYIGPIKESPVLHPASYNSTCDEDNQSIRSEGGSIRLYNVNDRIKQNRRNVNQNNWDRNYNAGDRRSNSRNRNYDSGNYQKNNNRNYTRPPRFNKQQNNNEFWRNSSESNMNRSDSRGPEPNSRSSSRNRNVQRPPRGYYENYNGSNMNFDGNKRGFNRNNNQHNRQQSRNFGNSSNNRYGSHNSLNNDSNTWERRPKNRNSRGKSEEFFSHEPNYNGQEKQPESWGHEHEIAANARNTTKYMQYLTKK